MTNPTNRREIFESLRKMTSDLRDRSVVRFLFRFSIALLIVAGALSSTVLKSLEQYRYAFVELEMAADHRGLARIFVNSGEGYQAKGDNRVRFERGIEPEVYRFQIPARDLIGLQLDPSTKPGQLEISGARILDARGKTLRPLIVQEFKNVEGPIKLATVDGKLLVDVAKTARQNSRIQISDEMELDGLRRGFGFALLLWISVVLVGAGVLSYALRISCFRRVLTLLVRNTDRVEQAASSRKWAITVVVLWCVVLAFLVIRSVVTTQNHFSENHPYFFDPVSYALRGISQSLEFEGVSRLQAAVTEAVTNFRYPLRTIPLILTDSSLLAHPLGHLITGGATFLALLILFCWTVFRRSGSLLYGLAATALLAAMPWHFDCYLGLGAYWLDTVSAYFVLLAALALLNWERRGNLWWIAGFAVFASGAVLSRYLSVAYVLTICGPLLLFLIWKKVKGGEGIRDAVVRPLLVVSTILGILAFPYLIGHLASNLFYYTSYGYAIGNTVSDTFGSIVKGLSGTFLGYPMLLVLFILLAVQLIAFAGTPVKRVLVGSVSSLWIFVSILLFQVFVIRTVEAIHQFSYVALLMVFSFVSPICWPRGVTSAKKLVISSLVIFCAVIIGTGAAGDNRALALFPSAKTRAHKKMDLELASVLISEGPGVIWAPFFDEYGPMPSIEAFLGGGVLPGSPSTPTFSIHEKYFTAWYPNKTKEEISDAVLDLVNSEANIAVVMGDLERIETFFDNDYSKAVSRNLSTRLPEDPNWEEVYRSRTSKYGELIGYRNRRLARPSGD